MNIKRILICIYFLFICLSAAALSADTIKTLWSVSHFGDEDFFHRPSDIEIDRLQSFIYIADSGNHRVLVFDFNGKFIKIIGRKGQGTAEFVSPTGLYVFKDSRLAVADFINNRIQIFDKSGNFLRSINTKEVRVADLIFVNNKFYTIPSFGTSGPSLNMGSKEDAQPIVVVLDDQGNKIQDISVDDFPETHPFVRAIKHRVCLALSPENKLYLPYFAMNVIHVFDLDGTKVAEFKRPLPFKPITPKLEQQKSSKDGVIQMIASLDIVCNAAKFGPDNNLYILSHKESLHKRMKGIKKSEDLLPPPMQIEVIDPNSKEVVFYIATDPGVKAFALIDKGRLVYIHEDSEGELILKCIQF
ncbi:MAG: NHL repeat-containing protein [Candidatus Aminicenantes bacterium]|nr:NHL repeat-containing protein [Candidatus Aminicenantes bacterium]